MQKKGGQKNITTFRKNKKRDSNISKQKRATKEIRIFRRRLWRKRLFSSCLYQSFKSKVY